MDKWEAEDLVKVFADENPQDRCRLEFFRKRTFPFCLEKEQTGSGDKLKAVGLVVHPLQTGK